MTENTQKKTPNQLLEQPQEGAQADDTLTEYWYAGMPLTEEQAIRAVKAMEGFFRDMKRCKASLEKENPEPCRPCPYQCYIGTDVDAVGMAIDFFMDVCVSLVLKIKSCQDD